VNQILTTPDETTPPAATAPNKGPAAACFTVLLAEDDRALRRYLEVVLRRAGYGVVAASDGLEAMKAALAGGVDAVVTDAVMPHLGGRELCRFLRRHPKLKGLPLILLSGSDGADAAGCEADLHLSKPVRAEDLHACLARLLERD
jgi:CheY-like chemotaxis protein